MYTWQIAWGLVWATLLWGTIMVSVMVVVMVPAIASDVHHCGSTWLRRAQQKGTEQGVSPAKHTVSDYLCSATHARHAFAANPLCSVLTCDMSLLLLLLALLVLLLLLQWWWLAAAGNYLPSMHSLRSQHLEQQPEAQVRQCTAVVLLSTTMVGYGLAS